MLIQVTGPPIVEGLHAMGEPQGAHGGQDRKLTIKTSSSLGARLGPGNFEDAMLDEVLNDLRFDVVVSPTFSQNEISLLLEVGPNCHG